jgi:hypothetical protein
LLDFLLRLLFLLRQLRLEHQLFLVCHRLI